MMSNGKIYLSKSNRANPDYVMLVRTHLEELGYEVLEHQGGDYDHNLMFEARYMVMVGQECPSKMNDGVVMVGKGQYNQMSLRKARSTNYYHLYYSHTNGDGKPIFKSVQLGGVVDVNNWTTGYGKLIVNINTVRSLHPRKNPIHQYRKKRPRPVPEPMDTVTEKLQDEMMDRMEGELVDQLKPRPHLACITLFK